MVAAVPAPGEFRFGDVRRFAEIDSTNRYLLDEARAGAPEFTVAVADHQTSGRGRLGRTWEAPAGAALLCSVLFRPSLPPERLHLVTAAVGLAARDALDGRPDLKGPNDLLLEDHKLAGILAEADLPSVVVGIGVNVTWAPPGAACLGPDADREDVLGRLLRSLDALYGRWEEVATRYRVECATVGRRVRVELADETFEGTAEDLTDDGHLVVDGRVVLAGDVVHLRAT
jgi:BirA family biotin operon repressor/biotin-[acetyl-CoA-carboxylase] ligase